MKTLHDARLHQPFLSQNRVLYLGRPFILVIYVILNFLTDPVPSHIVKTWHPSFSLTLRGSSKSKLELESVIELEDTVSDSAKDQSFGFPLAVDQVEEDGIGVQTGKSFASD